MPAADIIPSQKLELSGALDQFDSFKVTPCIGTEFRDVNLPEWIRGENSDAILRDLAITSQISPSFVIPMQKNRRMQY